MMRAPQDTGQRKERNLGQGHQVISQNQVSTIGCLILSVAE